MFEWFTDMGNTKPLALVIFFVTFVAIIIYVYGSKRRSKRFESYKDIPLQDDDEKDQQVRDQGHE